VAHFDYYPGSAVEGDRVQGGSMAAGHGGTEGNQTKMQKSSGDELGEELGSSCTLIENRGTWQRGVCVGGTVHLVSVETSA